MPDLKLPTQDDLLKLPQEGLLILAIRCIKRVWPPQGSQDSEYMKIIEDAITYAEKVLSAFDIASYADVIGFPPAAGPSKDTQSQPYLFYEAALIVKNIATRIANYKFHGGSNDRDIAIRDISKIANNCKAIADATGSGVAFVKATHADYVALRDHPIPMIDASETGPLGPYWPN